MILPGSSHAFPAERTLARDRSLADLLRRCVIADQLVAHGPRTFCVDLRPFAEVHCAVFRVLTRIKLALPEPREKGVEASDLI